MTYYDKKSQWKISFSTNLKIFPQTHYLEVCNRGKFPPWHAETKCLSLQIGLSGLFHMWGCSTTSSISGLPGGEISPGEAGEKVEMIPLDYWTQLMTVWGVDITDMWEINVCERVRLRRGSIIFPPRWIWAHVYMYTKWIRLMCKSCVLLCLKSVSMESGSDSQAEVGEVCSQPTDSKWKLNPLLTNMLYNGDQ